MDSESEKILRQTYTSIPEDTETERLKTKFLSKEVREKQDNINYFLFVVAIILAIVGLGLGFVGYGMTDGWENFFEMLHRAIRLFVLGFDAKNPHWTLLLAMFICPLATSYSLVATIWQFSKKRRNLREISGYKKHYVICGLNKWTAGLASDINNEGGKVVIIVEDETNPQIPKIENQKIRYIIGKHSDPLILRRANVNNARHLIAFTENDNLNMEIAINSEKIIKQKVNQIKKSMLFSKLRLNRLGEGENKTKIHVHLSDKNLYDAFSHHEIFFKIYDYYESVLFNIYENDARLLFIKHDFEEALKQTDKTNQVHLVLLGFGNLGKYIFLQAVRMCHYSGESSIRITVMGDRKEWKRFMFKHQESLDKLVELYNDVGSTKGFNYDFKRTDFQNFKRVRTNIKCIDDTQPITSMINCIEGENKAIASSLNIVSIMENIDVHFRFPLSVHINENDELFDFTDEKKRKSHKIIPYGILTESCTKEIIIQEILDRVAMNIHQRFLDIDEHKIPKNEAKAVFGQEWRKLPEIIKDSNRLQADHTFIKLRYVDAEVLKEKTFKKSKSEKYAFSESEIDDLARAEHNRYCAERFIAGWRYGPDNDRENKINKTLIPYDKLPKAQKNKDRDAVATNIHQTLGYINLNLKKKKD